MAAYITTDEAQAYGAVSATPGQLAMASRLIDQYCRRPEGLVWMPDHAGRPAYMAALSPSVTYPTAADIAPGANVVVQIGAVIAATPLVGEVVILDRAGGQAKTEVCTVTAASGTTITLDRVEVAHSAGCLLEVGLVIVEERKMPAKRSVTNVSRPNFARLLAVSGRYGYGRRSDQMAGTYNEVNLLATLSTFGGPPPWVPVDVTTTQVSASTGEVWVPAGIMLAYYTDVALRYLAGFSAANLPEQIKVACALLASEIATGGDIPLAIASFKAGDTQITRAGGSGARGGPRRVGGGTSIITSDIAALLDPFRIKALF